MWGNAKYFLILKESGKSGMESANFGFNEIPPKYSFTKIVKNQSDGGFDIFDTITRGSLWVSYRLRYVSVQCRASFEWCDFILDDILYLFVEVPNIFDQMRIPSGR